MTCPRCKRPEGGGPVPMDWYKRCQITDSVECRAVEAARAEGYEAGYRDAARIANAQATIDWTRRRVLD